MPFMKPCKKYGRPGHTRDGSMIQRMHSALWIPKATDTH